jgi:hypothetical protein
VNRCGAGIDVVAVVHCTPGSRVASTRRSDCLTGHASVRGPGPLGSTARRTARATVAAAAASTSSAKPASVRRSSYFPVPGSPVFNRLPTLQ